MGLRRTPLWVTSHRAQRVRPNAWIDTSTFAAPTAVGSRVGAVVAYEGIVVVCGGVSCETPTGVNEVQGVDQSMTP